MSEEKKHLEINDIMQFSGEWQDWSEKDYSAFLAEMIERRQTTSRRNLSARQIDDIEDL